VAVSHGLADRVIKLFPHFADKMMVVPNGVDEAFFSNPVSREGGDTLRLVSAGNLVPGKGMDVLIRALPYIESDKPVQLSVIGEGAARPDLEKSIADLDLAEQVVLEGKLPYRKMPGRLRQADIFVFASHSEGRPNAVLEAMASGLPVVASDIDGVNDIVRHEVNGLLFEAGNEQALAEHISTLAGDAGLRQRYGETGRRYITDSGLTWGASAQCYMEIYSRAMGESQRAPTPE
jgi:glycosyltransferase involved in cell wall biosynthesis